MELKYTSTPAVTKSMRVAAEDLKLDHLDVVHPGQGRFPLAERITAAGLMESRSLLEARLHPG